MARSRPYTEVDVFTSTPYLGNPLAVVLDGTGLDQATRQRFANWTNLSETTFLLPPSNAQTADYKVHIHTTAVELPFAGHPTLGSCRAWLEAGGVPRASSNASEIIQECPAGLIRIRLDASTGRLSFAAPPLVRSGALSQAELALACKGMGVRTQDVLASSWLNNGPPWCGLLLKDAKAVLAVKPALDVDAGFVGIVGAYKKAAPNVYDKLGVAKTYEAPEVEREQASFEVRAFVCTPEERCEDPCTGSLNAALAQWLIGSSLAPSTYQASQGARLGRAGQVHLAQQGEDIWVGGDVAVAITGHVTL